MIQYKYKPLCPHHVKSVAFTLLKCTKGAEYQHYTSKSCENVPTPRPHFG